MIMLGHPYEKPRLAGQLETGWSNRSRLPTFASNALRRVKADSPLTRDADYIATAIAARGALEDQSHQRGQFSIRSSSDTDSMVVAAVGTSGLSIQSAMGEA